MFDTYHVVRQELNHQVDKQKEMLEKKQTGTRNGNGEKQRTKEDRERECENLEQVVITLEEANSLNNSKEETEPKGNRKPQQKTLSQETDYQGSSSKRMCEPQAAKALNFGLSNLTS